MPHMSDPEDIPRRADSCDLDETRGRIDANMGLYRLDGLRVTINDPASFRPFLRQPLDMPGTDEVPIHAEVRCARRVTERLRYGPLRILASAVAVVLAPPHSRMREAERALVVSP